MEKKTTTKEPTKLCKSCREEISVNAKKCPHCQTDLRGWPSKHSILTVLLVILILPPFISGLVGTGSTPTKSQTQTSVPTIALEPKEKDILTQQKALSEEVTKKATDYIASNNLEGAIDVARKRWNYLTKLRADVLYDKELSEEAKKNIDYVLKEEQEGLTRIITMYENM